MVVSLFFPCQLYAFGATFYIAQKQSRSKTFAGSSLVTKSFPRKIISLISNPFVEQTRTKVLRFFLQKKVKEMSSFNCVVQNTKSILLSHALEFQLYPYAIQRISTPFEKRATSATHFLFGLSGDRVLEQVFGSFSSSTHLGTRPCHQVLQKKTNSFAGRNPQIFFSFSFSEHQFT